MIKARSTIQRLGLTSGYTTAPESPHYSNSSHLKNENLISERTFDLPVHASEPAAGRNPENSLKYAKEDEYHISQNKQHPYCLAEFIIGRRSGSWNYP